jgi:tetratricopeptide (TPR) repeat protein
MDTGQRKHLQDIYSTDQTSQDDYTPQVSNEVIEQRKREIRRHQFTSFVLGMTVLVLLVALVIVVVKKYVDILTESNTPVSVTSDYIPRHSLPPEKQWVLDVRRDYGDPTWTGEGERPLNAFWLTKAAYNVIMAQQATELGKSDPEAYKQAAEHYEQALEIMPDLEGVKIPLGMVYFKLEELDKALKLLEDAPDQDLTFDILNNLAAACIEAKAYERAEEYLKRSLELKPTYANALQNQAMLYKELDRPGEAIRAFEQYLDQRPGDTNNYYDFALYLTKIGRWDLAAEKLRILVAYTPEDHTLYFLLARAENKLGNSAAATAALRRGIQLVDPKLAIAWMDDSEFDQLRNTEEFQALIRYVQQER